MGGVSGAVLILPFQVSFLGFVSPSVSPTNLIYNIVAIPSGVLRYLRENRMVWPLAWIILVGIIPGIIVGTFVRIRYLPDPHKFKLFAGIVLAYIGFRLIGDLFNKSASNAPVGSQFEVKDIRFSPSALQYRFNDTQYGIVVWKIVLLSLIVGVVSSIYGIGGGSFIAPLLVVMFALPVHSIAGVVLFSSFVSSIAGILSYATIARFVNQGGPPTSPDWMLGVLFGIGGAGGMYVGARLQRFVPAKAIKGILSAMVLFVALKYIVDFFRG